MLVPVGFWVGAALQAATQPPLHLPVQRPVLEPLRLPHPTLSLEPEQPGFVDGLKLMSQRFEQNFKEGQALAKARMNQAPVAAAVDTTRLRPAALALSALACELLLFCASLLAAWAVGLSPATAPPAQLVAAAGGRTAAAIQAALVFRGATRPLRLALQLGAAPLVAAQASLRPAPFDFLKDRAVQVAAVGVCAILTLRALERGPLAGLAGAPLPLLLAHAGLPPVDGLVALAALERTAAAALAAAEQAAPLKLLLGAWCALANLEEAFFGALAALWRGFLSPVLRVFFKGETDAPVAWLKQLRAVILQTFLG